MDLLDFDNIPMNSPEYLKRFQTSFFDQSRRSAVSSSLVFIGSYRYKGSWGSRKGSGSGSYFTSGSGGFFIGLGYGLELI